MLFWARKKVCYVWCQRNLAESSAQNGQIAWGIGREAKIKAAQARVVHFSHPDIGMSGFPFKAIEYILEVHAKMVPGKGQKDHPGPSYLQCWSCQGEDAEISGAGEFRPSSTLELKSARGIQGCVAMKPGTGCNILKS